jgi:hypothetical protein
LKFKRFKIIIIGLTIKIKFLARKFLYYIFCNQHFSPLVTFMRKEKDPDPDPEPVPHQDPYCGSGRPKNIDVLV